MLIDKIGSMANSTIAVEAQTTVKIQGKPSQEPYRGDVVSVGTSKAISAMQIKWPPLFPIGRTQGVYDIGEQWF